MQSIKNILEFRKKSSSDPGEGLNGYKNLIKVQHNSITFMNTEFGNADSYHNRHFAALSKMIKKTLHIIALVLMSIALVFLFSILFVFGDHSENICSAAASNNFTITKLLLFFNPMLVNAKNKNNMNRTPLFMATVNAHEDMVNYLISKGAIINVVDSAGITPLHGAAQCGLSDIVILLISKGADVNAKTNKTHITPLIYSIWQNSPDVAKVLIVNRAEVNAISQKDLSPLKVALALHKKEISILLCVNGAQIHDVYEAAGMGNIAKVKLFLKENPELVNRRDYLGNTPLHFAVINGYKEIANLLISNGADINTKNDYGKTVLTCAVEYGFEDIVEFLISKNADLNTTDMYGKSVIEYAKEKCHFTIISLLRKHSVKE